MPVTAVLSAVVPSLSVPRPVPPIAAAFIASLKQKQSHREWWGCAAVIQDSVDAVHRLCRDAFPPWVWTRQDFAHVRGDVKAPVMQGEKRTCTH